MNPFSPSVLDAGHDAVKGHVLTETPPSPGVQDARAKRGFSLILPEVFRKIKFPEKKFRKNAVAGS